MKTNLVLAGRTKAEIVQATGSALDKKKDLPALEPGSDQVELTGRIQGLVLIPKRRSTGMGSK